MIGAAYPYTRLGEISLVLTFFNEQFCAGVFAEKYNTLPIHKYVTPVPSLRGVSLLSAFYRLANRIILPEFRRRLRRNDDDDDEA